MELVMLGAYDPEKNFVKVMRKEAVAVGGEIVIVMLVLVTEAVVVEIGTVVIGTVGVEVVRGMAGRVIGMRVAALKETVWEPGEEGTEASVMGKVVVEGEIVAFATGMVVVVGEIVALKGVVYFGVSFWGM